MLKRLLFNSIVLLLCLGNFLTAQNLVPNYSFENYNTCPDNSSQIMNSVNWTGPINNDSDLFNSCSTIVGVPYNNGGNSYQYAKTGEGYAGLWAYNGPGGNYREYIQTQLLSVLNSSECYLVEFYVNLMSSLKFGVNNIGLNLTNTAISSTNTGLVIDSQPQILKFNNPIIIDTVNWIKITGVYTAIGDENYITLGNFNFDDETDTSVIFTDGYFGAYYYIDDVSIIAVSDLPNAMPAYAGEDQYIEIGDSIFIGQEISNLNCNWSILGGAQIADSISGIWVQPTVTTSYVVEQNLCGTITYDTVTVFVHGVGLSEWERDYRVSVFPNPNKGSFEVDLSKIGTSVQKLVILDASGRLVYEDDNITMSKITIETSLEKGIYSLRLLTDLGVMEEKVVIY